MKNKIAIVLIFLMCMLNMVPGLFSETLYLLLTFLGFSIPFLVVRLNKWFKRISALLGGWCFAGLIVEILNFTCPEYVINSHMDKSVYFKFVVMVSIGTAAIMTGETWMKKAQKK